MKALVKLGMVAALVSLAPAAVAQGGPKGGRAQADMYAGMSPGGRQIMSEAALQGRDPTARDRWQAAHERMLSILDTDPLDRDALADAMKEQGKIMDQAEERRREAMLKGFSLLSAADRKAWVANDRARRKAGGPGMQGRMIP